MTRLVSAEEMKSLEQFTIKQIGIPAMVLMERATLTTVEEFGKGGTNPTKWSCDKKKVLCVCGTGNNGGDGCAVARLLAAKGIDVEILFVGRKMNLSKEASQQFIILENCGIRIYENDFNAIKGGHYTTIIDAIFGIGLSRKIRGKYKDVVNDINKVNKSKKVRVLALDIPSGISADSGEVKVKDIGMYLPGED